MKYQPHLIRVLTAFCETRCGTVPDGQFNWGGFLLKSNGGAQWSVQYGWQSYVECKGINRLNCETYKSSRWETRS